MNASKIILSGVILTSFVLQPLTAFANIPSSPDLPINHCYHWLDERSAKFLTFKYAEAKRTGGEFSFYTTGGNGAVAGPGIYCAKTPLTSYNYGDRLVRIEFVDDIVETDGGSQVCGYNGNFYPNPGDCARQPVDVHLYNTSLDWYVIRNPKAIKSWSANSDELIKDLIANKQYADAAASSHFDMTMMLMKNEEATIPKRTWINPSARLDILDILKDPKKTAQIPIMSLVEMIAAASPKKIGDQNKRKLYASHLTRALHDELLAYSDYSAVLDKYDDVRDIFKNLVVGIDYSDLKDYNVVMLLSAIDKQKIKVGSGPIRNLWQALWNAKASYESLLAMDFDKKGDVIKEFDSFIPANLDVDQVQDKNLGYLLSLLDKYLPAKANTYVDLTEKLLNKLLAGPNYYVAESVYDALKNPALDKEKALVAVFRGLATKPNTSMDLLTLASLYDRVKNDLTADQVKALDTSISGLAIKVSPRLSFLLLEDFKAGKLKLSSLVDRSEFLNRLIDRSIAERSLGANTTNTYRMILSGYYSVFNAELGKAKDDTSKVRIMKQAASYFNGLANRLAGKDQDAYAYAAWQNALYFENGMTYKEHAIEGMFAEYLEGKKSLDQKVTSMVVNGQDTGVLLYLVYKLEKGRRGEATKAELLLSKILDNYVSSSFQKKIQTKTFKLVDNEKRIWANFLNNEALAPHGTVRSDLCTYNANIHMSAGILSKKFSSIWQQVDTVKNAIYEECKK
jgi:hypothetical protein